QFLIMLTSPCKAKAALLHQPMRATHIHSIQKDILHQSPTEMIINSDMRVSVSPTMDHQGREIRAVDNSEHLLTFDCANFWFAVPICHLDADPKDV
ncbi:hypothetical protein STEG23_001607, partial [Scotinomys teguina]